MSLLKSFSHIVSCEMTRSEIAKITSWLSKSQHQSLFCRNVRDYITIMQSYIITNGKTYKLISIYITNIGQHEET